MDFRKLMNVASKNEQKAQKDHLMNTKPVLATKLTPPKKDVKSAKGVQSAAVRAFLERRDKEECEKAAAEQLKKTELMRLRREAQHDRKAHAMASRTKDNLKVFTDSEDKTTAPVETQDEPVVDLKHLFTKHDHRVPHLPSEKIPDMLSAMKERQKQRKLAQEKAKQAADAAEAAKVLQQKLDRETHESDLKHKKLCLPSSSVYDRKHSPSSNSVRSKPESELKHKELSLPSSSLSDKKHSAASNSVLPKSALADKGVESKGKVKKKSHPPPMSFEQLMALANQKQAEPVIDVQPSTVPKKVSTEHERPMTQEEKDRQKRRETKEYQDWLKYGGTPPTAPSSGKSRHQQRAGESYKSQRMTVSSKVSGNDSSDESDSETDDIHDVQAHTINGMKSYSHSTVSRLKDDTDIPHKQSPATKTHSEKLFTSHNDSSQRLVDHPKPPSRSEFLFTKGKVMSPAKANDAGQNGKSKSLSDELIEKLKEERRKMVDSGDAVPSLADMLQDLLNKVRGETNSQELTSKQYVPSGTTCRSSGASSSSTKSKRSIPEQKAETFTSALDGPRSRSSVSSGTRPSSQYVTVNETVVDCARDKSSATKPVKTGDKRPVKSTWEDMYERSRAKDPNRDDRERKPVKHPRPNCDSSDDEDEVDDMDDFIDDGSDTERRDYSHYIRELFGYDRRKFANEKDDDLRGMESSYSQMLKEDAVSTKLGLLEDLEDMRREEEEKLQKMGKLKAKKPRLK